MGNISNFESLRNYLDLLESKDLLTYVEGADWNLEIGAVTELVAFSDNPHGLLFDKIRGYSEGYRVATDIYVSQRLQALALGLPEDASGVELVKLWRDRLRNLRRSPPREVSDGPVKENIIIGDDVNILRFPVPLWHENDAGRYFGTGDIVITFDPEEKWVNAGVYRSQVHDDKTLGLMFVPGHHGRIMMEKYWAKGRDAPVVITAGQDPILYCAACAPLPWGYSELEFAGGLRDQPIDAIIDSETSLPVPAQAEIAVMGHVPSPAKELRQEGPFGECTGYYAGHGPNLVVHIDKIWHRNNPILQGNPTMHGSAMMHALGAQLITSASVWDALEREVPNVQGVYSLYQPCQSGSTVLVVSIKQSFAGHAKQAAFAALGSHAGVLMNKAVIIVDEDVDASNLQDVLFAVMSRCDPSDDIDIVRGVPTNAMDPALTHSKRSINEYKSSSMIIDATRKPFSMRDKFPRVNVISPELKSKTLAKWGSILKLK